MSKNGDLPADSRSDHEALPNGEALTAFGRLVKGAKRNDLNENKLNALRIQLLEASAGYAIGSDFEKSQKEGGPNLPREFENVRSASKRLIGRATELSDLGRLIIDAKLHTSNATRIWRGRNFQAITLQEILRVLETIIEITDQYDHRRTPKLWRSEFFWDLADIYVEVTGLNPNAGRTSVDGEVVFRGPFFEFVDSCLRDLGISEANTTLGSALTEALEAWRSRKE